jgi:hypothetical protein
MSSPTTSVTHDDIAMLLVVSGFLLLFTIVIQASLFHGYPLSQLGQRPIQGRGLFEYIYYGSIVNKIGVWGYDPIQGAFSPILRFLCHCSIILILSGCSLYVYTSTAPTAAVSSFHDNVVIGGIVLMVYLLYCTILCYVLPGVSVPPGPRPHKIQRIPQWYDQYWNINSSNQSAKDMKPLSSTLHRYVHGQESHTISEQIHNVNKENNDTNGSSHHHFSLTGEPAGRDMWTATTISTKHKIDVTDDVIQALASGGRPYTGFNPNINPNRYVHRTGIFTLLHLVYFPSPQH